MRGTLYGIGVGPGDPELMTLKAVKCLKACPVLAIPQKEKERCTAYQIAVQAVPEIKEKEILCIDIPMTKGEERIEISHQTGAKNLTDILETGKDVALITLGDCTVYASSMYLLERVKKMGYPTEVISAVPSFCAAAARLQIPLVKNSEELHILPASYPIEEGLALSGVKVLMKTGKQVPTVKRHLQNGTYQVQMVEKCGMPGEKVYHSLEEIPDDAGYFSLFIVRDTRQEDR